jgi:hypothetical protein
MGVYAFFERAGAAGDAAAAARLATSSLGRNSLGGSRSPAHTSLRKLKFMRDHALLHETAGDRGSDHLSEGGASELSDAESIGSMSLHRRVSGREGSSSASASASASAGAGARPLPARRQQPLPPLSEGRARGRTASAAAVVAQIVVDAGPPSVHQPPHEFDLALPVSGAWFGCGAAAWCRALRVL